MKAFFIPLFATICVALGAAGFVAIPIMYSHATIGPVGIQVIVGIAVLIFIFIHLNPPIQKKG